MQFYSAANQVFRSYPALTGFLFLLLTIAILRNFGYVPMPYWGNVPVLKHLPRNIAYAEFKVSITEAPLRDEKFKEIISGTPQITGEIIEIQTSLEANPTEYSGGAGLFRLTAPFKLQNDLLALREGDIIAGRGTIELAGMAISGDFDYFQYLHSCGICGMIKIDEFEIVRTARQDNFLSAWRHNLALSLIAGLEDRPDLARMAVTLGLGRKEFMGREEKLQLSQAGIIHAFAISGLHVGMVAAMLLFALRWIFCPLRWRWLLAALGIIGYVWVTGFSPSATRALVMTLLMFYAWHQMRPANALNAMGVIGCIAVFYNPAVIFNTGFIYSYIVVFALIFCWPGLNNIAKVLEERDYWIPVAYRKGRYRHLVLRGSSAILMVSVLAWITCAGLSLYCGSRICLISPLLNLPIAVLVPVALLLCLLKMGIGLVFPALGLALSCPLKLVLAIMQALTEMTAESSWVLITRQIALNKLVLYYLAWFGLACFLRYFSTTKNMKRTKSRNI